MTLMTKIVMSKSVIAIQADADLASAYKMMKDKKFRHLPVVDKNHHLIGIISSRDLVEFDSNSSVRDFMSSPVATAAIDTPLGEVTQLMIDKKISALVVMKNENIVGIITTEDLLRVLKIYLSGHSQPPQEKFNWKDNSPVGDVLLGLEQMGFA